MPTYKGAIRLFQISGITVFLHWSWFFVAVLELQRQSVYTSRVWSLLEYLTLFGIVLLHEFGHALGLADTPTTSDLMYPGDNETVHALDEVPNNKCSANDCASLRAVYSMPTDVIFYSARR